MNTRDVNVSAASFRALLLMLPTAFVFQLEEKQQMVPRKRPSLEFVVYLGQDPDELYPQP